MGEGESAIVRENKGVERERRSERDFIMESNDGV